MNYSRREVCLNLSLLAASGAAAAGQEPVATTVRRFEDLLVHARGANRFRPIINGLLHDGNPIEAHATELAPGSMPHPPHHHLHEEMFLVREGTLEVTVNGQNTRLGAGGVAFVASNDQHGIKNVGETNAQYFVIAMGRDV